MENRIRGLSLWVTITGTGLVALGHQVARAHHLYVAPQGSARAGMAAELLGVAIAVVASRWRGARRPAQATSVPAAALLGAASAALLVSVAPLAAFDHGELAAAVSCACVGVGALFTVLAALETWRTIGRAAVALGLASRALQPLRLLALTLAAGAALVAEASVGFLRAGLFTAIALALSAGTTPPVLSRTGSARRPSGGGAEARRASAARRVAAACAVVLAACGAALAADDRLPLGELARYPDEVVFASDGDAHRYVVTAAPGGYELFRDGQLAVATLDAGRAARALVSPALSAVGAPGRVALLGGGAGALERVILDDPRVKTLTVVTDDAELDRLARSVAFLTAELTTEPGGGAPGPSRPSRLRRVVAEPLVWLSEHVDRFDVVVASFPAPTSYGEGKYYTRHAFRLIAEHLGPGGVSAFPATSAWSAPESFASILVTAGSAGLHVRAYHVALPTLGIASFALGSLEPLGTPETIPGEGSLDIGADLAPSQVGQLGRLGRIATLHDQHVVSSFDLARERAAE